LNLYFGQDEWLALTGECDRIDVMAVVVLQVLSWH